VPLRLTALGWLICAGVLLTGGCPPENFPGVVPPTLQDVTRIVSDTALTVQEKRAQLTDLGLAPLTINALLRDQRLGNQFGGDLRTAFDKVTSGRFTELTPDEVQVYGDQASAVAGTFTYSLTDAEAQAVVSFFAQFDLDTSAELSTFVSAHPEQVPETIPAGVLTDVFVNFDPQRLLTRLP